MGWNSPRDDISRRIEAIQTDQEREMAASLPARAFLPGGMLLVADRQNGRRGDEPQLNPRPLSLKALAGRILGQADN